ncbi:hypothetical protein C9J01_01895 [Photobacterium rosenbergii]|uniref:Serine aminopeptidase S33 domain-containing protein n=1 Tax=Photobacterium rosenbergii TaxID=294936 RepID=A0A2T3NK18_9GAMM|nr:alpha/beta fold hydrolase [Photobacterium rosenbergii]PSW15792.1 hypothetical protein C9J01_01895 [Photobacterium rosenbergii]
MAIFTTAALAADALALGPHWIYNPSKLKRLYPNGVYALTDPKSAYHPNRRAGQLTHYGDQIAVFRQYLEIQGVFNEQTWREHWLGAMVGYDGYLDGATKQSLKNAGYGSDSNDLAGASRLAPLLDLNLPLEATIQAAREQTSITHSPQCVADAAELFVRMVFSIQQGNSFSEACEMSINEGSYTELEPERHFLKVKQCLKSGEQPVEVATQMGTTCHTPEAFPLTLYFALQFDDNFADCLSENALVGGDSAARGIILSLLFAARDGDVGSAIYQQLTDTPRESVTFTPGTHQVSVLHQGKHFAATLDIPNDVPKAFILFAHCFTCGKDFLPEKRLCQALAKHGFATLRIDFSGVGGSGGEFVDTSFLTNVEDLGIAASWMSEQGMDISALVGHSLGGTASLAVAGQLPSVKAVITIGSPFEPKHILHLFEDHIDKIKENGQASVMLAGRPFTIGERFLSDLKQLDQRGRLGSLKGVNSLVIHVPDDDTVDIKNAGYIYSALPQPKSFLALQGADHLLQNKSDVEYVAKMASIWLERALNSEPKV